MIRRLETSLGISLRAQVFWAGLAVAFGSACSSGAGTQSVDNNGGTGGGGAAGGTGGGGAAGGASGADAGGGAGGPGGADGGSGGGADGGGTDAGDGGSEAPVTLSVQEWALVETLSPLPFAPPRDPTNRVADDARAATLGQRLFFEKGFSGPLAVGDSGSNGGLGPMGTAGLIACASCHAGPALDDRRSQPGSVSLGADYLTRNSPPLVNASFYTWTNWAGRFSAQWELPPAVVENARNMNGDRLRVAHVVFDKYRAEYEAIFGALEPTIGTDATRFPPAGKPKAAGAADGPWELMTDPDREVVNVILVNFGKTVQAYLRKLVGGRARFDRFVAGDGAALASNEIRGLKLFVGNARCITCHAGPLFSDNEFHNLGLPQSGDHVPPADQGRFADVPPLLASRLNTAGIYSDDRSTGRLDGLATPPPDETRGQFRTPSLRNVAVTAPYMHAGQLATLADVVDFYDTVGQRVPLVGSLDPRLSSLGLTSAEKADLVSFLGALTGTAVPAPLLENTAAPN